MTSSASALNFLTEENPPLNFLRDGKVGGMASEAVREMARRASLPANLQLLAWADAYGRAQQEEASCVFSTVRTPDREKMFIWLGPIARGEWSMFVLQGFSGEVRKIEDLKKYRIGVVRDARANYLRNSGFTDLVVRDQNSELPALLTTDPQEPGKIDLWFTQTAGGADMARQAGVTDLKVAYPALMSQDYWLACNPQLAPDTFRALRDASYTMRSDGTYKRLAAKR
ncbi:MAG: transporter substrate-binding domain-containing protein [Rhodoferax sp.]|nr:transporter substrate-binding domain-containing protein [Rhodoferax sp.]